MDRLSRAPVGDCDICSGEHVRAIAVAIRELGGALTEEQRAGFDELLERADAMWIPLDDPFDDAGEAPASLQAHATRARRPGRNDPCHCGSGKKYERCHLEADGNARN
ncbi:SEC-C metal-binding domain-containing protein [Anaeromyxobacter oryzae]|uniref:SEC-C motif domain protein n=1 Tax=Anaeromyxobacter oryzae TaxID=2918170 RepID=A0ABN6MPC5_9BACT|nr:SEC-C metal-binding domain-containing protein [Anaeromyxobacter oryzae]BDG02877.1 hypothetical protein AMOR_18730 [Anaeromyxobacter oryzae]